MTASRLWRLVGTIAVDEPRYPEAIDEHAKPRGPEGLLEGHHNLAVLGQLVKDTLGVSGVVDLKRERKALWLLVTIGRNIATHQHLVAECNAAVHDLVLPVAWNLVRHRRTGVAENPSELTAETLLI